MINIILCGGSGTRLWPISRQTYPKQFTKILDNKSLFQATIERNAFCSGFYIVTNESHFFNASDQIVELNKNTRKNSFSFLLEPVGRNTAPAIALACLDLDPEEIVLVTPSDHLISDENSYNESVKISEKISRSNNLVTFGIKPEYPETGYGYIEGGNKSKEDDLVFEVANFHEKPDLKRAEEYLANGHFYWNSGMFVFKAGAFLDELRKYSPEIYESCQVTYENRKMNRINDFNIINITKTDMENIPSDSIDYAVMEKSKKVFVIPSDIGWNDLGSFDSLYNVLPKDASGNTQAKNIINVDSSNNLIITGKRKMVTIGLEDLVVVDTTDAILIGKKGKSQLVKQAVDELKSGTNKDKDLTLFHSTVHRPWGTYTVLEETENYKIKKIIVKPGNRISLQKHIHRSEHWTVVSGTATVTVKDKIYQVCPNESTFIPIGAEHRLENEGFIDLVIIETQVGEYVGEDDIIRLKDDYQREL